MGTEHEIVFEDLHGAVEDDPLTVDLDADENDDGISRSPTVDVADDDDEDDDIGALAGSEDDDDDSSSDDDEDDDASNVSDDDDAWSKSVRKRIAREQKLKQAARDEADYWKRQAEKLAKDSSEANRTRLKERIEQADTEIGSVEEQLEAAIEAGNTKEHVKLSSKLTDLKAEKIQAQVSLDSLPEDGIVPPFDGKVSAPNASKQSLADKWVEDRSDWYGARGFERQTRLANRIDKEVMRDDFDPDTPEYFKELDRRLKKAAPELYEDDKSDRSGRNSQEGRRDRGRRSTVASVSEGSSGRKAGRGSKVDLTKEDFANMRRFGLNTKDPAVVKEYARNKAENR